MRHAVLKCRASTGAGGAANGGGVASTWGARPDLSAPPGRVLTCVSPARPSEMDDPTEGADADETKCHTTAVRVSGNRANPDDREADDDAEAATPSFAYLDHDHEDTSLACDLNGRWSCDV